MWNFKIKAPLIHGEKEWIKKNLPAIIEKANNARVSASDLCEWINKELLRCKLTLQAYWDPFMNTEYEYKLFIKSSSTLQHIKIYKNYKHIEKITPDA